MTMAYPALGTTGATSVNATEGGPETKVQMKNNGRNVPSKFVIDMSVPLSLDSPAVTRTRPVDLRVVGSSITNPACQELTPHSDSHAGELMTSSDNERGLAAMGREARQQFIRTLSNLREESQSSLAYLEQLQSNQVPTPDMPLPNPTHLDTEEMDSNGDQFDSSYFFPPSQHPIACNDTFEISPVHKSINPPPINPSYPPVIDLEAVSLNEGSFTTQEVDRNVTTGTYAEGSSPVDISSFSVLPLRREISLSDPHLFSLDSLTPGQDISPARMERKRSLSDSCLARITIEELQAQVPLNRAINSTKFDSESLQQKGKILSGQSSKNFQAFQNGIEIESQLVGSDKMKCQGLEINFQGQFNRNLSEEFFQVREKGITSNIENGDFKEIDLQETNIADPINLYQNKGENVFDPEGIQRSDNDSLEANISQDGLIHESVFSYSEEQQDRITVAPPILTENEPQTSKAINSQGRRLVDNMWDEFSFSQYLTRTPKPKKTLRNTIPCPFSVYYKSLEPKKKTPAQLQGEAKRRLELESEQIECSKKFTSRPVPKSTYEPRYQEILSREENRRQQARNISKEALQSIVKPFKFDARVSVARTVDSDSSERDQFRARPVPKHLFLTRYEDEVAEQDLYREIRTVMRTNKLLSASRLPRSMSASERSLAYTDGHRRRIREENNSKQAFLTTEHRFKPTVNKRMPDFKRQQELFEQQLSDRKEEQRLTRVEFSDRELTIGDLEIGNRNNFEIMIPSVSDVLRVTANQTVKARRRQTAAPKAEGVYGHGPTKSTRLRQHLVQRRISEQASKEREERERAAQQTERVRRMERQVAERVRKLDTSDKMERAADEKKRQFRKMDESRENEYAEHIRMIKERLEERPLVFERVAQETARERIANKFNSLLRKSGVSEDKMNETFTKSSLSRNYTDSII